MRGWARGVAPMAVAVAVLLAGCSGGGAVETITVTQAPTTTAVAPIASSVQATLPPEANRTAPAVTEGSTLLVDGGPVLMESLPPWHGTLPWGRIEARFTGAAGSSVFLFQPTPEVPDTTRLDVDMVVQGRMEAGPETGVFTILAPSFVQQYPDQDPTVYANQNAHAFAVAGEALSISRTFQVYQPQSPDWEYPGFLWALGGTRAWDVTVTLTLREVAGPTVGPSGFRPTAGFTMAVTPWEPNSPPTAVQDVRVANMTVASAGWSHVRLDTMAPGAEGLAAAGQCTVTWADGLSTGTGTGVFGSFAYSHLPDGVGSISARCTWSGTSARHEVTILHMPITDGTIPDGVKVHI